MKNTRLLSILCTLPTRERTKFKEYVHSPFFNKNKKVQMLCDYVLHFSPKFDQKELNKQAAFNIIFEGKAYAELQINNIISDLLQLLYAYLAHQEYQKQPQIQKDFLLEALLKKELNEQVEPVARRYEQLQHKSIYRNNDFYLHQYNLCDKLDRFYVYKIKDKHGPWLQSKSDNLDLYYMSTKLRLACNMASNRSTIKADYDCHFLDEVIANYEQHLDKYATLPCIVIYYKTLQMLQNENEEQHFHELKTLLAQNVDIFPKEESWTLYNHLLNYCIRKINSGKSYYYEQTLELYNVMLEKEIIFNDGKLSQWSYKNIVTIGLRTQRFGWTKNFIEKYKTNLSEAEKENALAYNLAAYYYETKAYKKALQELHNVEFTDTSYHLGAKIIQLKNYYELDESEAFFALLEAFSKYILRNKQISDYRKKANDNMLKLAKRIYQLKIKKDTLSKSNFKQKIESIQHKLQTIEPIANKDWLEEKFELL